MNVATPNWVKDALFYQIFPDRFAKSDRLLKPGNIQPWGAAPTYNGFQGGDLLGVVEKLDYLVDLGVNAIYLNPIFSSAANHRYHTHDYFRVDPLLGGDAAFRSLLDAAHQRDIRVILDGVFNHSGRGILQFNHLLEAGRESPYVDWFHVYDWPVNAFDEQQSPNYAAWWGLHALPKFNVQNPQVREFLWSVGTYWLEQGIDGWRLDVPTEINDEAFWAEFRSRCRRVNPDAYIVAELWEEAQHWLQGDLFDAQMNYMFARAAFGFFCGDNLNSEDIGRSGYNHIPVLDADQFGARLDGINNQLYHQEIVLAQMNLLGSHDTPRLLTVANHDKTAVRLMFLCLMTQPGAPNIYYGDEIGMAGRHDPDNRRAFPWHDPDRWDNALRADVKRFIALRRAMPALRRGNFKVLCTTEGVLVYMRQYQEQTAVVAFNINHHDTHLALAWPAGADTHLPERLITGRNAAAQAAGPPLSPGQTVQLPARSGRVWAN